MMVLINVGDDAGDDGDVDVVVVDDDDYDDDD